MNETKPPLSVMIVDDDIYCLDLLRTILHPLPLQLMIAENGLEGLNIFKEVNPSMVITDLRMPVMSGLEMIKEIRKKNTVVPIISISSDATALSESLLLDVNYTFEKPFSIDKMVGVLKEILEIKD